MASVTAKMTVNSKFRSKRGSSKLRQSTTDASPDSKCPICLDRFNNISYLNQCLHRFCFRCIKEWSKNKAECPLCKQPFNSILHSIRAEDDFKEYTLKVSQEKFSFSSPNGQRFRYRTTVTGSDHMILRSRRTVSPPDNGVIFEGLGGHQPHHSSIELHRATRRHTRAEGQSITNVQVQEMISFRRALYRTGTRVISVQDGGRFREISAEFFRRNPACLHRLVPWLKRELTVLFGLHGSLVNIVQHIIMTNVTIYDMESPAFAEDLRPFLLQRTDHFLHEFITFAQSPFNMDAYDQHANYDVPTPHEESHSDSSVITISPDEADPPEPGTPILVDGTDQAPWDDETPGPSYSTSDLIQPVSPYPVTYDSSDEEPTQSSSSVQAEVQVKSDPGQNDGNVNSPDEEDCVVVGYVKPLAERTPELVELSSDSEGSLHEEDIKNEPQSQHVTISSGRESSSCSPSKLAASKSKHKVHKKPKKRDRNRRRMWSSSSVVDTTKACSRLWDGKRTDRELQSRTRERSRNRDFCWIPSRDEHIDRAERRHYNKERHKSRRSRSHERMRYRDKRRSRSKERSVSRRSRTVSITSESTTSRDHGRSRSRSSDRGRRRSWSKDKEYSYLKDSYQSAFYSYLWESCSHHDKERDGYDSFYRKKSHAKSYHKRCSRSPENRIRYTSKHRNSYKENRYWSRSHSSSSGTERNRHEKPSGKRKYKTRHLENRSDGNTVNSCACSSSRDDGTSHRSSSKYSASCRNDSDYSVKTASSESKLKKKKRKSRSPSVEIVFEGKNVDASKHHKKKKRKHRRKHKRHRTDEQAKNSSPVVITIDSDSEEVPAKIVSDHSVDHPAAPHIEEKDSQEPESVESLDSKNICDVPETQHVCNLNASINDKSCSEGPSSPGGSGTKNSFVEQIPAICLSSQSSVGENNAELLPLEKDIGTEVASPVSYSGRHPISMNISQLELQDQQKTALPIFDSLNALNTEDLNTFNFDHLNALSNSDSLNTLNSNDLNTLNSDDLNSIGNSTVDFNAFNNAALEHDDAENRTIVTEDLSEFSDRPRLIIKLPKRLLEETCLSDTDSDTQ
ncbi:E3 ubiquitin-protein ligase Topors [Protopterus annectens]|uniref:E3 ubiquitin-protein ligase Topors n=1 Tax=Protopterus annectens TaxID=7888 RepID=UPI001CFB219A|nr:E3 ubiquitin-protein ligase Topors [Protopterus annectens]XP_043916939.1 E3 ubiquitin-protein ligase Topors [Protopterus annectens]